MRQRPDATHPAKVSQAAPPKITPKITPEIAAEAAVWVARLHGPDLSGHMQRECLEWQERSAAHRLAFERCTDTWQDVPSVTLTSAFAAAAAPSAPTLSWPARRPRWPRALAVAAMVTVLSVALHFSRDGNAYRTGVGEQQVVVLNDGTRVSLNTATRLSVDLGPKQRTVTLERGEALFEVAKDAHRPFVVRVAGSEVVAIGTVFAVRLTVDGTKAGDKLAVTLIEGQVAVRRTEQDGNPGAAPVPPVLMQPGERVRLATTAPTAPLVDKPRIEQVMAWKRSEAVFDDVSLQEAVAEMNRYSRAPIVLAGDAALAERRISGLFRTGDNVGFARAVAAVHGLAVHERQGRLELAPIE
jgi:transmembrane sensor